MNKFVKEGIIFSVIVLIIFAFLNLIVSIATLDYVAYGFPLPFYEGWGPCPPGMICQKSTPINSVIDVLIVIGLGFGASYIKNSVMKK